MRKFIFFCTHLEYPTEEVSVVMSKIIIWEYNSYFHHQDKSMFQLFLLFFTKQFPKLHSGNQQQIAIFLMSTWKEKTEEIFNIVSG